MPCSNTADPCPVCERCGYCVTTGEPDGHARTGVEVNGQIVCVECYADWGIDFTEAALR
jgi:hypothetical protein